MLEHACGGDCVLDDGRPEERKCKRCLKRQQQRARATAKRRAVRELYASVGMTEVRGALGGRYYE